MKSSLREADRQLLTFITAEEYRALSGDEQLQRGSAAERERRRFRNSRTWLDLRYSILRGHERCASCGGTDDLTIDHIHPIVRGGSHDPKNLQILCGSCNSSKGAK